MGKIIICDGVEVFTDGSMLFGTVDGEEEEEEEEEEDDEDDEDDEEEEPVDGCAAGRVVDNDVCVPVVVDGDNTVVGDGDDGDNGDDDDDDDDDDTEDAEEFEEERCTVGNGRLLLA